MSENNILKWEYAQERIEYILSLCQPYFSNDTIEFIQHYLSHREYEMAAEGLFISMMESMPPVPNGLTQKICLDLAKFLKLDEETVYQKDFWKKFFQFCQENLA